MHNLLIGSTVSGWNNSRPKPAAKFSDLLNCSSDQAVGDRQSSSSSLRHFELEAKCEFSLDIFLFCKTVWECWKVYEQQSPTSYKSWYWLIHCVTWAQIPGEETTSCCKCKDRACFCFCFFYSGCFCHTIHNTTNTLWSGLKSGSPTPLLLDWGPWLFRSCFPGLMLGVRSYSQSFQGKRFVLSFIRRGSQKL